MLHYRLVWIPLAVVGMIIAVLGNIILWNEQAPYTGQTGPWTTARDLVLVACLVGWIWAMTISIQRSRKSDFARNSVFGLVVWVSSPVIAALALWDRNSTGRDLVTASWHWVLKPLPIDVSGAFKLEVSPNLHQGTLGSIIFVLLQIATITLVLLNVGILLAHYKERSIRRLKDELLLAAVEQAAAAPPLPEAGPKPAG